MAFLIPDNILETLVCDTCNKYLSVKPITIYPNRRTKCGRCSRTKKRLDGVNSLYEVIAEKCIFKCVNRFDGCRELLTCAQVREHEKTCTGKFYQCPVCPESSPIPTFLFLGHFQTNHKEWLLDCSAVFVRLHEPSEASLVYLYKQEDNLFLLQLSMSKLEEKITVNLCYLGGQDAAKNITQQFFVIFENKEYNSNSKVKPCTPYGTENHDNFIIENLTNVESIFIKFSVVILDPKLIKLPLIIEHNESDVIEFETCQFTRPNFPSLRINTFSPMVKETHVRKIFLSPNFQQKFPNISLSKSCEAVIESGKIKIYYLHCFNCQEICWRGLSRDSLVQRFYYSTSKKSTHSICYYCFQMLKQEKKIFENDYMVTNFSQDMLKQIEFSCSWNCGETSNAEYHLGHEESCKLQPLQSCPELDCNFKGTILDISLHMSNHPGREICTYSNFYMSCLFNRNVYLFIQNQFVHLKIVSNQGLNISIDCLDYDKNKNRKPVVLLFDDNKHFLMSFQNSITKKDGNHWLKVILQETETD